MIRSVENLSQNKHKQCCYWVCVCLCDCNVCVCTCLRWLDVTLCTQEVSGVFFSRLARHLSSVPTQLSLRYSTELVSLLATAWLSSFTIRSWIWSIHILMSLELTGSPLELMMMSATQHKHTHRWLQTHTKISIQISMFLSSYFKNVNHQTTLNTIDFHRHFSKYLLVCSTDERFT